MKKATITNWDGLFIDLPQQSNAPRAILSLKKAGDFSFDNLAGRAKFLETLGIDPARACYLKQIHSQTVVSVPAAGVPVAGAPTADGSGVAAPGVTTPKRGLTQADGLLTTNCATVLCVTVSDCLPVWLHDPDHGAFGLLHSGWRGTGIAATAVQKMHSQFGTRVKDLQVTLGPCIGSCCYNVPRDRSLYFKARFGADSSDSNGDEYFIDLRQANINLLTALGVEQITVVDDCTSCQPALSSYRRDGADNFSLMLAVMGYF